jgi:hypothetical protein
MDSFIWYLNYARFIFDLPSLYFKFHIQSIILTFQLFLIKQVLIHEDLDIFL